MSSRRPDYKKKLLDFRRTLSAGTKSVAFKDHSPLPDEKSQTGTQDENGLTTASLSLTTIDPHRALSPSPQPTTASESSILFEPVGKYTNWKAEHTLLASLPWCCVGDLMDLCDKYEFKVVSVADKNGHIVNEVRSLLSGKAPFDVRKRFTSNIRNPENLMVCIGRCPSVEYHLGRILSAFRKPLDTLSPDKQRIARQNFHLAIRELRLDISARVTEIRLYDQKIFERDFHLTWEDTAE